MAEAVRDNPLAKYAADFLAFAADLHVPLGASSGRLGDNWAEFQQVDFAALAPALSAVARGQVAPIRRFWIERTKGGSKDSDCAVAILWLLAFAPRAVRVQVGAYDREQASELRYIVKAILAIGAPLNRLLAGVIEVQASRIIAHAGKPGRAESVCEILTTDAWGSHGARPDVVIANELTHVGSEAFMQTLLDNADKIPHSLVIVATNSGEVGTWQEKWRDIARASERWHVSVLSEPSPWISPEDLAESELRNPLHRFNRLWRGIWSSGEGDTLSAADIAACTTLDRDYRFQLSEPCCRMTYGGIDLGIKHDHSAICVLEGNVADRVVNLKHVESWRPQDFAGGQVDIATVEKAVITATRDFEVNVWGFDPWQALHLAQNLAKRGVPVYETPFTASNKDIMARSLLSAFRERLIRLYPDAELRRDLLRLRIRESATHGGYRLDSIKDEQGHADRAIALAIALPSALRVAREFLPAGGDVPQEERLYA
jgi:hypothetical protein